MVCMTLSWREADSNFQFRAGDGFGFSLPDAYRCTFGLMPRAPSAAPADHDHCRAALISAGCGYRPRRTRGSARSPATAGERRYRRRIDHASWFTRSPVPLRRSTASRHTEVFGSSGRRRTSFRHSSRADRSVDRSAAQRGSNRARSRSRRARQLRCLLTQELATWPAQRAHSPRLRRPPRALNLECSLGDARRTHRRSPRIRLWRGNPSPSGHSRRGPQ